MLFIWPLEDSHCSVFASYDLAFIVGVIAK